MKYKYYKWIRNKKVDRYDHIVKVYRNKVRSYYVFNNPQPNFNKRWSSAPTELGFVQKDWDKYRDLYKEMTEEEIMLEML